MKMIKKVLNKIAYIFICINQDIKMRYEIQKEVEDYADKKEGFIKAEKFSGFWWLFAEKNSFR